MPDQLLAQLILTLLLPPLFYYYFCYYLFYLRCTASDVVFRYYCYYYTIYYPWLLLFRCQTHLRVVSLPHFFSCIFLCFAHSPKPLLLFFCCLCKGDKWAVA